MVTLEYKKTKYKILSSKYKKDTAKISNNYKVKIKNIKKKYSKSIKLITAYIKKANIDYKKSLSVLKKKFDVDKKKINTLTVFGVNAVNRRALLIGINYKGTSNELFGCINDVNSIKSQLSNVYGFKDISIMTDDTLVKPTSNNIYNKLKQILENSVSGDLIFISYSGHGSYIKDTNGDEDDGQDEMIIGLDLIGIKDDTLKTLINTYLKSGVTLIMLFDSCFSGTILDLKYQYKDTMKDSNLTINNKVNETAGNVIVISSSQDDQPSADSYINKKAQGAATWGFIKALTSNPNPSWSQLLNDMRTSINGGGYTQVTQLCSGRSLNINTKIPL